VIRAADLDAVFLDDGVLADLDLVVLQERDHAVLDAFGQHG